MAIGNGARRGELLGLRWQDVNLPDATVTIRRSLSVVERTARLLDTKATKARALAIGPSVVGALGRRRTEQDKQRHSAGTDWMDRWGLAFTRPSGKYLNPRLGHGGFPHARGGA